MALTRRACLELTTRSLLACGLGQLLRQTGLATDAGQARIDAWLNDLAGLGRELGAGQISQVQWQAGMDEIYRRVPLAALLQWVDFRRLGDELAHRDLGTQGEVFQDLFLGQPGQRPPAGPEQARILISKIAYIKKGRSIPPHGHSNMVSAFLVMSGDFHVRQFDKLADRPQTMLVRATADERQRAGQWSGISDHRNNVHWLTAQSDDGFLFTVKLIRLEQDRPFHGRINIDVRAAKDLGDGRLEAPKISFQTAAERY